MHPRTWILIAACTCAFVVMASGFGWATVFDLDSPEIRRELWGWFGAAALLTTASFLPVWDWLYQRYHRD